MIDQRYRKGTARLMSLPKHLDGFARRRSACGLKSTALELRCEHRAVGCVIIDHEHVLPGESLQGTPPRLWNLTHGVETRRKPEGGAQPLATVYPGGPSHQFGQPFDDREPKPSPSETTRR